MTERKEFDRREFLKKAGSVLCAGASIPLLAQVAFSETAKKEDVKIPEYKKSEEKKAPQQPLVKRKLGKTGLEITALSMGVMRCTDPAVVMHAYEMGINFYDTAAVYQGGRNEEMLGNLFKEQNIRDKVYIQTKVGVRDDIKWMQDTFDSSLKKLKTDRVEVLLLHGIESYDTMKSETIYNFLQKQKKDGKARFIGYSTHSNMEALLLEEAKSPKIDVILSTYNISCAPSLKEAIKKVTEAGVGIIAMKTQVEKGKPKRQPADGEIKDHPLMLKSILADTNVACAVPGVTTIEQLKDFQPIGIEPAALNKSESERIRTLLTENNGERCTLCGQCSGVCKFGMKVNDALRASVYLENHKDYILAKDTMEEIINIRKGIKCFDCGTCTFKCKQAMNVKDKIIKTYNMLA